MAEVVLPSGGCGCEGGVTLREVTVGLSGRFLSSNDSSSVTSPWFISPGMKEVDSHLKYSTPAMYCNL